MDIVGDFQEDIDDARVGIADVPGDIDDFHHIDHVVVGSGHHNGLQVAHDDDNDAHGRNQLSEHSQPLVR